MLWQVQQVQQQCLSGEDVWAADASSSRAGVQQSQHLSVCSSQTRSAESSPASPCCAASAIAGLCLGACSHACAWSLLALMVLWKEVVLLNPPLKPPQELVLAGPLLSICKAPCPLIKRALKPSGGGRFRQAFDRLITRKNYQAFRTSM